MAHGVPGAAALLGRPLLVLAVGGRNLVQNPAAHLAALGSITATKPTTVEPGGLAKETGPISS